MELKNLTDAIEILDKARYEAVKVDFAWLTVKNAEKHIQKQVAAYFAAPAL